MYAKWIHPKKIIPFDSDVLRYNGTITVNPTATQLVNAGYYPVILKEGETIENDHVMFYEKNREIHILREGDAT